MGTTNGLYRRSGSGFTRYAIAEGLSRKRIDCLLPSATGELWIGTENGGLNRLKDGRFTVYTTEQGLLSDQVGELLEDDDGWRQARVADKFRSRHERC